MLLVAHTNHSKLKHDVQYYLIKFGQDFGVVNQLTNTHPTLRVVECVTEAYTAFSEFLAKTVKFYIESRLTSVFEGFGFPWETRFQQLVTRIETAFQRIREIAQTEHFSLTGQTQTEIRSTGQETIDLRKHLELEMKNEVQGLFETFAKNWISRFEQLLMESKQDRGTPPNLHEAENFSTGPYSVIESTKWTAEQAPRSRKSSLPSPSFRTDYV